MLKALLLRPFIAKAAKAKILACWYLKGGRTVKHLVPIKAFIKRGLIGDWRLD